MLDTLDLDVVYCVMYERWILQPALDCLNAGKHLFTEKPPGAQHWLSTWLGVAAKNRCSPHPHVCSEFVNPLRADSVDLAYIAPACDVSYKRVGLEASWISIALAIRSVDPTGMGSNLGYLNRSRAAYWGRVQRIR